MLNATGAIWLLIYQDTVRAGGHEAFQWLLHDWDESKLCDDLSTRHVAVVVGRADNVVQVAECRTGGGLGRWSAFRLLEGVRSNVLIALKEKSMS
jgi:hypothetical protein